MNKTTRNVLYITVIVVCVISIFVGVYAQFFKKVDDVDIDYNTYSTNVASNNTTMEDVKNSFKDLFTNEYFGFDYDESNINKIDSTKPIVYSGIKFNQEEDEKYDVNATLPVINISETVTTDFNNLTQSIFVEKLNNIIQSSDIYTICDMSYTSYVNNDILSVAIMASIKEGDNAQRIAIQTYNYNILTKQKVSINDIIESRDLDKNTINKKISSVVNKAAEDAKSMQNTGYNIYERDIDSNKYDVDQVENFIQGPNGELYIIYAYGNEAFTSEMDVIEI